MPRQRWRDGRPLASYAAIVQVLRQADKDRAELRAQVAWLKAQVAALELARQQREIELAECKEQFREQVGDRLANLERLVSEIAVAPHPEAPALAIV